MLDGQAGLIALRRDGSFERRTEGSGWRMAVSQGIPVAFLRAAEPYLARIPPDEDPQEFELPEIHRLFNEMAQSASLGVLTGFGLPMVARQRVVGIIFNFPHRGGQFYQ